jgi:hypothetical protein
LIAEVTRVLKPDGEFSFFEHCPAGSYISKWQPRLNPLWKAVFDGCHINLDIAQLVDVAVLHYAAWSSRACVHRGSWGMCIWVVRGDPEFLTPLAVTCSHA